MADILSGSISEFLDFMPDTVTIYPYSGNTSATGPSWSVTGTAYPCRIEMSNHLVVDRQGRTVTSRGRVIMGTATVPDVKDKIVLPSEYTPVSPPIIDVDAIPDELGGHHTTLHIG